MRCIEPKCRSSLFTRVSGVEALGERLCKQWSRWLVNVGAHCSCSIHARAIKPFGSIALACIEHEQCAPTFTSHLLHCLHKRSPSASTPLTLVNKELLHFGSMQRIWFHCKCQLHRTNDTISITR